MGEHLLPGSPPVAVTLRRSGRARRISLRISQLDGRVTLTMPQNVRESEAIEFAQTKEEWIRKHLGKRPDNLNLDYGGFLPVEGIARKIVEIPGRRIVLSDTEVGVPNGRVGARLQSWLRAFARDRLAKASDEYALRLGLSYDRITLRDTRSRWGSCTSNGGLMYSWRLILAPPEVLQYVAAHEVSHLAEMNHSQAFWATVERLHGPYQEPRRWLRTHGNTLHRYRF